MIGPRRRHLPDPVILLVGDEQVAVRMHHHIRRIEQPRRRRGAAIAHGPGRLAPRIGRRLFAAPRHGSDRPDGVDPPDPLVLGIRNIEVAAASNAMWLVCSNRFGSQVFCRFASARVGPAPDRRPRRRRAHRPGPATVVRVWASSVAIRNSNPRQARTLPF